MNKKNRNQELEGNQSEKAEVKEGANKDCISFAEHKQRHALENAIVLERAANANYSPEIMHQMKTIRDDLIKITGILDKVDSEEKRDEYTLERVNTVLSIVKRITGISDPVFTQMPMT